MLALVLARSGRNATYDVHRERRRVLYFNVERATRDAGGIASLRAWN